MNAHHDRGKRRFTHIIHWRRPLCAAAALLPLLGHGAVSLGDADIRSFLGQPLDVRITVRTDRAVWLDTSCIAVRLGDRELVAVPSGQLRLRESIDAHTLIVRSIEDIVAPYLTMELTVRCDERSGPSTRTYDLMIPGLHPPVVVTNPVGAAPSKAADSTGSDARPAALRKDASAQGIWTTGQTDTLERIARGIYPRSARMQQAFLSRLRAQNPDLTLPADGERLAPGLRLRLPDLIALANESPRLDPQAIATESETAASTGKHGADRAVPPPLSKPGSSSASAAPAARAETSQASSVTQPPAKARSSAPAATSSPSPQRGGTGGGFALRLSGAEMDLSRSRGVSEATRAALRDKQMLLDADDQVAALLALRNTVKQLEGRLNEMQLKLSTGTLPVASAKPESATQPAVAEKSAAESAGSAPRSTTATPQSPSESAAPTSTTPSTPASPIAATPPGPSPAQTAPTPASRAASPAPAGTPDEAPSWLSPWTLGIATIALLLIGGLGWRWLRGRRGLPPTLAETNAAVPGPTTRDRATSDLNGPSSDDFPGGDWDDEPSAAPDEASFRSGPPSATLQSKLREAAHQETVRLRATPPDLLDVEAAALELDTRPATSVDFILGDEGGEDKSRRQRYMEERFPELAHHSISVDEPDSIIDAARHHYEEGQLQKAIELLTYAFEERPGQLRFWLALFEIHRLEQRTGDFAELAARFKNVHGGTDAWPKVQHIGRDLDPGQPLYAAALGRLGVPMDADFDPMSENWLNVPMDFTSDVLMIELRHSLMAEHVVLDDELRRPLIEVAE